MTAAHEPPDPLAALRGALARTREAGTARVMLDQVWRLRPDARVRSGPLGLLDRLALRFLTATFLRHHVGEGAIDLARGRCMLDFGGWATLDDPDGSWSGRSGSPLTELRSGPGDPHRAISLLEALETAVHATFGDDEEVRGAPCRRLLLLLDLNRAPGSASLFAGADDLHAVPVDVWIDAHVRRVRYAVSLREITLELWDVGRAGDLDWTRLPTSRSIGEAASDPGSER